MAAGAIYGGLKNTRLLITEFERLGPDYPLTRMIQNDYEELYTRTVTRPDSPPHKMP